VYIVLDHNFFISSNKLLRYFHWK